MYERRIECEASEAKPFGNDSNCCVAFIQVNYGFDGAVIDLRNYSTYHFLQYAWSNVVRVCTSMEWQK